MSERPFRLRDRLASDEPLLAVELRPPRRDLEGAAAMDAWIDVYHAMRQLGSTDTVVFLTDNAVGAREEENLGHLVRNIGAEAVRERTVPFLTLKHPLEYCLRYASRARAEHLPALVVLGGDPHDGIPRCLPHAFELRRLLRREQPGLLLGGWVNPHRDAAQQVDYLLDQLGELDFALTQIVSHHQLPAMAMLLEESDRRGLRLPLFAGVFFYRSPRRRTLDALAHFIPVPVDEIRRDFRERQLGAETIAAETVRALRGLGLTRFYLSNLETGAAARRLRAIARRAGLRDPLGG
jgi:hypothetical protein